MSLHDRINAFDFDSAEPHDMAVLLEQVFMYHDSRSRDGGPIIVAQGVLRRYVDSIRRRSAPELHASTGRHLRELRSTVVQLETTLRALESDTVNPTRG